eukprot:2032264-Rhodomonas_salina.1
MGRRALAWRVPIFFSSLTRSRVQLGKLCPNPAEGRVGFVRRLAAVTAHGIAPSPFLYGPFPSRVQR